MSKGYCGRSGFQCISKVIGATPVSSIVLIRKRPSGATSYCRCSPSRPPPKIAVENSRSGVPGATVDPITAIGGRTRCIVRSVDELARLIGQMPGTFAIFVLHDGRPLAIVAR